MRFELLGPLRLIIDGRPVNLGSKKRRILLAMLLAHFGRSVAPETLVNAMWEQAEADTGRNGLHWHVHQLRKTLGDPERVVRRDGGYALVADPAEVDAQLFRERCREGASALAAGDPARASGAFTAADKLWRATAYADLLTSPPLRSESERWEELRFTAVEQRCEAELRLGRHEALIPNLFRLVARHPFRDGLRGRLMLALYRSGRQAEALQVFRDGRDRLMDEQGIRPGPALTNLERAILRQDSALDAPTPIVTKSAVTPAELPSGLMSFTGRRADAGSLSQWLREGTGNAIVAGLGGVGKSALALYAAHGCADAFPDGQLYVDLHGATPDAAPLEPGVVLARFLRSLGHDPSTLAAETDELASRFRTATSGRRLLVLLDDAHSAAQVRPLLPGGSGCRALITSRAALPSLSDARRWQLDVFTAAEAMDLLIARLGAARVEAESEAAAELGELCGRFPLALSLAAANLAARPGESIADHARALRHEDERLSELAADDQTVRACFRVSYRELTDRNHGAAVLFQLLGLVPGPDIGIEAAASLAGVTVAEARRGLNTLADMALLDNPSPGRYRMHDLLRLYAREQAVAESGEEATRAGRRLRHHYLATARRVVALLHPQRCWRTEIGPAELTAPAADLPDADAAADWFDIELDNLMAVTRQSAAADEASTTVALAVTLNSRLSMRGSLREQSELTRIAVAAARRGDGARELSFALYDHAETLEFEDRDGDALVAMTEALTVSRATEDVQTQGRILKSLGYLHKTLGDLETALDYVVQGLTIHRRSGNHLGQAHGLVVLGVIHRAAERHEAAIEAHREAVEIMAGHGDPAARSLTLGNLAETHLAAENSDEAIAGYERALELVGEAGLSDTRFEAGHLWGLAQALSERGEVVQAVKYWREAAEILHRLGAIDDAALAGIVDNTSPRRPSILAA